MSLLLRNLDCQGVDFTHDLEFVFAGSLNLTIRAWQSQVQESFQSSRDCVGGAGDGIAGNHALNA